MAKTGHSNRGNDWGTASSGDSEALFDPGDGGGAGPPTGYGDRSDGSDRSDIEVPQSLLPGPFNYGFPLQSMSSITNPPEAVQSLSSILGAPDAVVRACVQAIATAAEPYYVVSVDVASSGPLRQERRGVVAPLEVRIQYARQGGIEVRESQVDCRLDEAGDVVALR